jgi:hypothetical protein
MHLTVHRPRTRPTTTMRRKLTGMAPPDRDRRSGNGNEDRALYSCSCGYAFKARVTTTVGCPQCGATQAW